MTDLLIPPSRNRGPAPQLGEPLIEVITQPMYSCVSFDSTTLPVTRRCFNFSVGQPVPGAIEGGGVAETATLYHTNMDVSGQLSTPKVFEVTGIRFVVSNLNETGSAGPPHPATASDPLLLEDLLRMNNGLVLDFTVGQKNYAEGPVWMFPGNCGVGGMASAGIADTTATEQYTIESGQGAGMPWQMAPYTIFIPSQQTFFVDLNAPGATTPTLSVARLAWVVLMGRLGREAQ